MKLLFASLGILAAATFLAACLGLGTDVRPERTAAIATPAAGPFDTAGAAPPPAPDEIRRTVERTLPYLEEHGVAWIEEHQCSSCHQVPVMVWSFHAAADRGLEVDRGKLAGWTRWVVDESRQAGTGNSDGIAHMILGRPEGPQRVELEGLATIVADAQKGDGSWKAGGQLPTQRRPAGESHRVSTGWALLALASAPGSGAEALERGRERFETWIDEGGESLEWLVVRLLYAERFGDAGRAEALLGELRAEQRPDGGWSWLRGEGSDAFGTGLGLYALGRLGHGAGDPAVRAAWRFLAGSQRDDGSWAVRSTLREEEGVTPTSDYWGTGWATIGLLSTFEELPPRPSVAG